jgi:antirestriction protein ArdC
VQAELPGQQSEALHQRGDEAYYSPSRDCIVLPLMEQFTDTAEYYSCTFHEMTHSTGHSSRLNRLKATAHFGNSEYSKEELVAEIGAAALMNITGTETPKAFRNSAAYIQNWLTALRNDRRMIVSASGAAQKAVDFILA